jgi:hypothetical protein
MTLPKQPNSNLNSEEWSEMVALRNAIHDLPQSVSPEKMEQFTAYLVRSIRENGG